jgi:hypothetical protein
VHCRFLIVALYLQAVTVQRKGNWAKDKALKQVNVRLDKEQKSPHVGFVTKSVRAGSP